ncbi:hypothetical protein D9M71_404460 [compost metagenome]
MFVSDQSRRIVGERLAAHRVLPEGLERSDQIGVAELVLQLPDSFVGNVRHAAVGIDDRGQPIVHTVHHGRGGFPA